jgi:hypothetical protein
MNIRVTGAKDQIERLAALATVAGFEPKVYRNRGSDSTRRLYVNIDDRRAESWLKKIQTFAEWKAEKAPGGVVENIVVIQGDDEG